MGGHRNQHFEHCSLGNNIQKEEVMAEYVRKPGKVEANQFFYGRPMIPGVIYPADRSEGSPNQHAKIFVDEHTTQVLHPGDWVIRDEDAEGETVFYVVKPDIFDLLFEEVA